MHEKYRTQLPIAQTPTIHPALFFDNSDCTFNYESGGTGAGWATSYTTACSHSCTKGIYLKTRSPGAAANDVASIWKLLPLSPVKLLTLELLFSHYVNSSGAHFFTQLTWYDGSHLWRATLRFEQATGAVARLGSGYTYYNLPGVEYCTRPDHWNHVRMAINFNTMEFQFVTVNNHVWNGIGTGVYRGASGLAPHINMWLSLLAVGAAYRRLCIDHILITPTNP